jgi:hypothetical protein
MWYNGTNSVIGSIDRSTSTNKQLYFFGSNTIFENGGSERMRISSAGVVETKLYQIFGTATSATQYMVLSENQLYRTGGGSLYINNSGTGAIIMAGGGGNVLIGTATDSGYKLDVNGITRASNFYSGGTYNAPNQLVTAGDTNWSYGSFSDNSVIYWMQVKFSGTGDDNRGFRVFNINGNTVEFRVNGVGNGFFRGSVTATSFFESSDKTIKTLIQDNYQAKGIESIIAKLYTKNGKEELGYFAQDVQGILPSAVSKGEDGLLSLSYREVLVAKVQLLEQKVKELEAKLN